MPGGVPVACVTIGKPGAKNAAILAAQIMALSDNDLMNKLSADRQQMAETVKNKDAKLQEQL